MGERLRAGHGRLCVGPPWPALLLPHMALALQGWEASLLPPAARSPPQMPAPCRVIEGAAAPGSALIWEWWCIWGTRAQRGRWGHTQGPCETLH